MQRKRDAILSVLLSSLTSFALLLLLLALRSGVGHWSPGASTIRVVIERPESSSDLEKPPRFDPYRAPARPGNLQGQRTRMIEAVAIGDYSLPTDSAPVEPSGWLERMQESEDDDFGWGVGAEGMGEAGGTFFGIERHASRFVFVLDYSSSMDDGWDGASNAGKASRISALRREVVRSIRSLPLQAEFAVIFFHDETWTLDDAGPVTSKSRRRVFWKLATQANKMEAIERISLAQTGGGTYWVKPLLEGLQMTPKPQVLYLLSDGEPTDWDEMKAEFVKIKMRGVAIDTIALESADEGAARLKALAHKTGGSYRRIRRGRVVESVESSLHKFRPDAQVDEE